MKLQLIQLRKSYDFINSKYINFVNSKYINFVIY